MNIEQKSLLVKSFLKRDLPKIFLVAVTYFLFGHLSLHFATLNNVVSPVWPATGIALFFLSLWGPRVALGVFIGALAVNSPMVPSISVLLAIGVGNTLEGLVGYWIFQRLSAVTERFGPHSRVIVYVAVSTCATIVSANFGTMALLIGDMIPVESIRATWLTWWVGDTLGALILFPLAVEISSGIFQSLAIPLKRICHFIIMITATIGLCFFVFVSEDGAPYLFVIFASLLLATFWFTPTWVYLTSIMICTFAIFATKLNLGPFYGGNLNANLLHLQLFLAGVGMTAIVLATLQREGSLRIPSLALAFGWILTGMTFYSFYRGSVGNDQEHFYFQVEKAEKDLRDSLDDYIRLLETGSGLFAASQEVTRDEWRAFTSDCELNHNIRGSMESAL